MTEWDDLSELEQLESIYCEMHKDVYGVKARWYKADTVEQARKDLASLEQAAKVQAVHDAECQRQAIEAFNQLATSYGGFETAKRWQHQAYGTDGDDEFLCYHLGLPYGFFKKAA
jgi:hypothetical protein